MLNTFPAGFAGRGSAASLAAPQPNAQAPLWEPCMNGSDPLLAVIVSAFR